MNATLRAIDGFDTNIAEFTDRYRKSDSVADASIDPNANVGSRSIITYMHEAVKPFFKEESFRLLANELGDHAYLLDSVVSGDLYLHDAWNVNLPYCYNYSMLDIAWRGLPFSERIQCDPPKHLYAFKSQVEQFVVYAANSTLGATGLADLLIVLALYAEKIYQTKKDAHFTFKTIRDIDNYLKETMVSLIYTLNWEYRGNQSAFTNVSLFDKEFLKDLLPHYSLPDDGEPSSIKHVMKIQAMFMDAMNEVMDRTAITFPVLTACFAVSDKRKIVDKAFARLVSQKNVRHGMINIYSGKTSTLSSCCRLRSDNEFFNSYGAGGTKIGSLGVVTINLPRIAYEAYDANVFIKTAGKAMFDCGRILHAKRKIIQSNIDEGLLPLYTHSFADINTQYSTIGIIGLHEAAQILLGEMSASQYKEFCRAFMEEVSDGLTALDMQYGVPHNVEQVPGESASVKLPKKDKLLYPDADLPDIYSNQFFPLSSRVDILQRISVQGYLDSYFSGGSVLHLNFGSRISEAKHEELIYACAEAGVVMWAPNYTLGRCAHGHVTANASATKCEVCGDPIVEQFTRVVGFFTSTKNWSKGKREYDFDRRVTYASSGNLV